ncbi:MAG TPA: TetR/AcrR family transcriptional regulator [Saprospiraceae bacterium]|nr:TetR/AcrR family transcriptional regulator [Saprospiraceae bacterium]
MADNLTEQKILEAATNVFQTKGMDGARMQEIADKAGINKAMLHYYYRSKQKLFEAVFKTAIAIMAPKLREIINKEEPLFDKIRNFTNGYISLINQHSYLPTFIIQELNRNPNILKDTFNKEFGNGFMKMRAQIEQMVKNGEIRPIAPEQLIMNVISMSIFPFVAKPILKSVLQKEDKDYQQLLEARKTHVADFIINAIKIQ